MGGWSGEDVWADNMGPCRHRPAALPAAHVVQHVHSPVFNPLPDTLLPQKYRVCVRHAHEQSLELGSAVVRFCQQASDGWGARSGQARVRHSALHMHCQPRPSSTPQH